MITTALLCALAVPADLTAEQTQLLQTFRQEFVHITPGKGKFPKSFSMGGGAAESKSAQPQHQVTFGYSFFMAKYEVPQNLWEAVMGKNPSRWKGPRNSVEMLSYDDALAFCTKVTQMLREAKLIDAGQLVRLPSEAEWEYCARAGTTTRFSFGDAIEQLDAYGWHTGNAAGNDPPVGAKKPNPWGLYDIHGYLWEWCQDVAHENYAGAPTDGSAWMKGGDGKRRVMRGGSWKDKPPALSSANRDGNLRTPKGGIQFVGGIDKNLLDDAVGLRCVLAAE